MANILQYKEEKKTRRERDALVKRGRMFVINQGDSLSALALAGLLSVVVLPFFSEQDLLKEGVDLTGKFLPSMSFFAKY